MAYSDTFTLFKTTEDGKVIYYPRGFWGKGYVIDQMEKLPKIKKATKQLYFLVILAVGFSSAVFSFSLVYFSSAWGWILGLLFVLLFDCGLALWGDRLMMSFTRGLVLSDVSLTFLESLVNSAHSSNIIFLLLSEIFLLYCGFISFQLLIRPWFSSLIYKLVGIVSIVFFGLLSLAYGYMILVKVKHLFYMLRTKLFRER